MSGSLREFLAAHADQLADRLVGERGAAPDSGDHAERARAFLRATERALGGDLAPLRAAYQLDTPDTAGLDRRLDAALYRMELLLDAVASIAARDGFDAGEQLDLHRLAAGELATVGRRLAAATVEGLAHQGGPSTPQARTSLSVTMHELRRPLTILSSYGQLLATGVLGQLPEPAMVALEGISASTEMMVRMVNALAEVARLEDPDDHLVLDEVNLKEIAAAALEQVQMEAQLREVALQQDVADARVQADQRRLVLALTNMLSNAIKHNPPGERVLLQAWNSKGSAHFLVADRGPGFPPEDAAKLYEKYFRSSDERKRKIPGSGLGLYIVKTVAERHGGTVVARSPGTGGAEFELIIPVHAA